MNILKTVKKIVAVAAGASIIGATLAGAMAADLNQLPGPFVQEGAWEDSVIVVGENAATSDVLGAIEIAASLQGDAFSEIPIIVDTTPMVSSGVKVEKGSNEFNAGEAIADVEDKLTEDDLPDVLADGVFEDNEGDNKEDVDYTQEIVFQPGTARTVYEQDDENEVAGIYLKFDRNEVVYVYTLDFDTHVQYDDSSKADAKDDFEGAVIEIQGDAYTITDLKMNGAVNELTLLAGDTVKWLQQDNTITVGDHTLTVVNVADSGGDSKCGIEVDGVMQWIDVGDTEEFGDLSVGVLDAVIVHSKDYDQDICEISVGSKELVLEDGAEVVINGKDIEGSEVNFGFRANDELDHIQLMFAPEDDVWLAPGEEWVDPVLGNWKVAFDSLNADFEQIEFSGSSSQGELMFTNAEGDIVDIPFINDDTENAAYLGQDELDDFDATFHLTNTTEVKRTMLINDGEYCTGDTDVTDCEGTLIFARSNGGEARILELKDVDLNDEELTIKDLTGRNEYTDEYNDGVQTTFDVGFMDIELTVNTTTDTFTVNDMTVVNYAETEQGARILLEDFNSETLVRFQENEGRNQDGAIELNWTVGRNGDDNVAFDDLFPAGIECEDGSDDYCGATVFGTTYIYDNEDNNRLEISYPEEQATLNVFISPVSATVVSDDSNTIITKEPNPFPIGIAVLDSEAETMDKNMIIVGGPCANIIAAQLAGNPESCTEGYEPGKAKLKLYDRNGKVALLVAGYSAKDTLGASYVMAGHENYDLSGDEVEVIVASLDDLDVVKPTNG